MLQAITPALRPAINVVGKTVAEIAIESFKLGVGTAVVAGTVAGVFALAGLAIKGGGLAITGACQGGEWLYDTVADQFRGNDDAKDPHNWGPVIVENHEPRDIRDIENWASREHNLADLEALVGRMRGTERNADLAA